MIVSDVGRIINSSSNLAAGSTTTPEPVSYTHLNGNFGYRDNPMANTNFVGDFEAEWLITRSGDIRLKAYNCLLYTSLLLLCFVLVLSV